MTNNSNTRLLGLIIFIWLVERILQPVIFRNFSIFPAFIIAAIIINSAGLSRKFWPILIGSLLFDVFSGLPFGLPTAIMFLIAVSTVIISKFVPVNHSLAIVFLISAFLVSEYILALFVLSGIPVSHFADSFKVVWPQTIALILMWRALSSYFHAQS